MYKIAFGRFKNYFTDTQFRFYWQNIGQTGSCPLNNASTGLWMISLSKLKLHR